MEAVTAASSVISILGVISQAVSRLAKLQKFFDEYERAPHPVKKLKGDISGLETTLLEVQEVVKLFQKPKTSIPPRFSRQALLPSTRKSNCVTTTFNFGLKRLKTSIQS
jgi:hypothetical protein